jgi:hypothetical protein
MLRPKIETPFSLLEIATHVYGFLPVKTISRPNDVATILEKSDVLS